MTFQTKTRGEASYSTLEEIIEALSHKKIGNDQTFVGKNYSKTNLIADLKRIDSQMKESKAIIPVVGEMLTKAIEELTEKERAKQFLIRIGTLTPEGDLSPNYYTPEQINAFKKKKEKE